MRFEFCEYDEDDGLMVSHVTIGRVVYSNVHPINNSDLS